MSGAATDGCGAAAVRVHRCPVRENRDLGAWCVLWLEAAAVAAGARPGQFVMAALPGLEFALRRPFSVHRVRGEHLALLIERRGPGSRRLARLRPGDALELSGPLGNGFDLAAENALLVAGGVGAAPLQFLADGLRARGVPTASYIGLRGAAHLPLLDAFDLPDLTVATEDGSRGVRGTVIDALDASPGVSAVARPGTVVYGCGPLPMLVALHDWAARRGAVGYASLEAHMACGTGACHGCVVQTADGYLRVCAEGPVVPLDVLVGEHTDGGDRS